VIKVKPLANAYSRCVEIQQQHQQQKSSEQKNKRKKAKPVRG